MSKEGSTLGVGIFLVRDIVKRTVELDNKRFADMIALRAGIIGAVPGTGNAEYGGPYDRIQNTSLAKGAR